MNLLPELLSGTAVLLAGAAFLRSLRGGAVSAPAEDSRLAEAIESMGRELGEVRRAVEEGTKPLEGLREIEQGQSGIRRVLEENGQLLTAIPDRLDSVLQARTPSVSADAERVRSEVSASVERLLEGVSAIGQATRDSLGRLENSAGSILGAVQELSSARMEAVSGLRDLGGKLDRSAEDARETARHLESLCGSSSAVVEGLASLSSIQQAQTTHLASLCEGDSRREEMMKTLGHGLDLIVAGLRETVEKSFSAFASDLREQLDPGASSNPSPELEKILEQLQDTRGALLERLDHAAHASSDASEILRSHLAETQQGNGRLEALVQGVGQISAVVTTSETLLEAVLELPRRTAEEIAARPVPAPELEELAIAVRDAGALRGDSVRAVADAVSRVSERLEEHSEGGRRAQEDAAQRLASAMSSLEEISQGISASLAPLGQALQGHGEAVLPMVQALEATRTHLEEAAVTLRTNQAEFASSVAVFTGSARELATGLGAFAREGAEEGALDPAASQAALLEALERLLSSFAESLRTTLAEADLRHREAIVELASRLPGSTT
ncbi:MAG: hypothetical protein H6686_06085 [Fibrobacteria bacterium]|nr:hypothetical protein [Fibrobacteria bacterium]